MEEESSWTYLGTTSMHWPVGGDYQQISEFLRSPHHVRSGGVKQKLFCH